MSIGLFLLALLSHALGATFPLVVLILIWWERGKIKRQDIVPPDSACGHCRDLCAMLAATLTLSPCRSIVDCVSRRTQLDPALGPRPLDVFPDDDPADASGLCARSRWNAEAMRPWHWSLPFAAIFVLAVRCGRCGVAGAVDRSPRHCCSSACCFPRRWATSDPNDADLPGVMVREHVLYLACAAVLVPMATLLSSGPHQREAEEGPGRAARRCRGRCPALYPP